MPLSLLPVLHDSEWSELIQCEHESYTHPFNGIYRIFRPQPSRAGFIELRDRQLRSHKAEPASRWFKVVDTELGDKVVGGAEWLVYPEDPYKEGGGEEVVAGWWPEGEEREFASKLMNDWLSPRATTMDKPHVLLSILYVHPEHRRRGVGSKLIKWGLDKADEMGVETFVEATAEGKATYAANGFRFRKLFWMDATRDDASPRWTQLEREMGTPIPLFLMVRPRGGGEGKGEKGPG